ncbi:hypothetical protein CLOM_g4762 [Closterium sp. NIES-68]|nr:hypothetical protein CLOM_g4762 [Closterium sp. NIES-68]GJP81220.1 hypothetical protein CLOP_g11385 [Closterium sp. NIES-67]
MSPSRSHRPSLLSLLLLLLSLAASSAIATTPHDVWGDADDDADDADEFDGHDASAAPGAGSSGDLAPTPPSRGGRRKGMTIPGGLAVERSFTPGDSNSFLSGGLIMMQGDMRPDATTTWVEATVIWHPLSPLELEALKALVAADGVYRVRLPPNPFSTAAPPQGHVVAWGRARCLAASGFRDSLHLLFDAGGRLLSAHVKPQAACTAATTAALDVQAVMAMPVIALDSDVIIDASTIAQRLPVRRAPVGGSVAGAGGAAGGVAVEEDPMAPPVPPKTFWQKYWIFIMAGGLLVLNIFTALAGPDAPDAPQGGAAGGGGARRGSGGGGGGRRA